MMLNLMSVSSLYLPLHLVYVLLQLLNSLSTCQKTSQKWWQFKTNHILLCLIHSLSLHLWVIPLLCVTALVSVILPESSGRDHDRIHHSASPESNDEDEDEPVEEAAGLTSVSCHPDELLSPAAAMEYVFKVSGMEP